MIFKNRIWGSVGCLTYFIGFEILFIPPRGSFEQIERICPPMVFQGCWSWPLLILWLWFGNHNFGGYIHHLYRFLNWRIRFRILRNISYTFHVYRCDFSIHIFRDFNYGIHTNVYNTISMIVKGDLDICRGDVLKGGNRCVFFRIFEIRINI